MYCRWAKFISRGFTECCWPSRYILSCERFICLKLYGFFLYDPLKASLSTHPMTILVGNCPVNKLLWVASRLPPGMVKVLHTTLRIGNFALPTSTAFACARNTDGLSFTFRTYNLHSKIRTLNAAPAAEDMRQNASLFLTRRIFIFTSLGKNLSWKNKSLCMPPNMSTTRPSFVNALRVLNPTFTISSSFGLAFSI